MKNEFILFSISSALFFACLPQHKTKVLLEQNTIHTIENYGTWGNWSEWSKCSNTCGEGYKQRSRSCISNDKCTGQNNETVTCVGTQCLDSFVDIGTCLDQTLNTPAACIALAEEEEIIRILF